MPPPSRLFAEASGGRIWAICCVLEEAGQGGYYRVDAPTPRPRLASSPQYDVPFRRARITVLHASPMVYASPTDAPGAD